MHSTRGRKDGNGRKRNRKNDNEDLSIDIKIKNDKTPSRQYHSVILQEIASSPTLWNS
ncbi:MAG: hypothetical protein JO297_19670 [Nitrososphaeraceae archaeon]|nr:hypothetical protein [Nitrososphaeraceae archaeon]